MEKILKKMKPLEKLDLKDRFLFDQVAEDPECCQAMLEIILDKEITILMKNETEKEFRTTTSQRSIKMDVFAADAEDKIYNMEMQQKNAGNLARRGRFYALISLDLESTAIPAVWSARNYQAPF